MYVCIDSSHRLNYNVCVYSIEYQKCLALLAHERETNSKFESFLQDQAKSTASGLDIESYMIKPVQRSVRFIL